MNRKVVGFFVLLVVGSALIVGYYFAEPWIKDQSQRRTSDAKSIKDTIKIGVDSWIGYFPLCSREMKRRLRIAGYNLKCIDDNADYQGRMKALKKGELDLAVATVDSFVLNGADYGFPATIVAVLDESKGGDAIVARSSKVKSLDDLKNDSSGRIAFTPGSPSEFLLKSVAVHFDVTRLRGKGGKWRLETMGSPEALAKLHKGEADVAVLWEPDVSKAIGGKGASEFKVLLSTKDTEKLIVDILLVNRSFSSGSQDVVTTLMGAYFKTLKHYRDNPDTLQREVSAQAKLSDKQATAMLEGVRWVTLTENAKKWMGVKVDGTIRREDLTETIESTVEILMDTGDMKASPIPDGNPYYIQNRTFVEELFLRGLPGQFTSASGKDDDDGRDSLETKFTSISADAWKALVEVGTLKIRPINFQSGTATLSDAGKVEVDKAVANLRHYPRFRVILRGHSGLRGDKAANRKLSGLRAKAVRKYMMTAYNIDGARLLALGYGSDKPLKRRDGESSRSYDYRLPRVEISLVSEVY